MHKKKKFVTIFHRGQNVDLVKAKGQIPYHMYKEFGYDAEFVCYKNSDNYSYAKTATQGLKLKFLKDRGKLLFWQNSVVLYLLKNARSIDVLNLQFLIQASMLYGIIYKLLNPKGILFIKMDMDVSEYKRKGLTFSEVPWKEAFHQKMYSYFLKLADIFSVESIQAHDYIKKLDKNLYQKTIYLPNGVADQDAIEYIERASIEDKENTILTVGRIGTRQKNNELLLSALSKIELRDWKVIIAGPINDEFRPKITSFFEQHPTKKDQITFTGNISNRNDLMALYKKTKIFCLPSRWESFGIVLAEAQCLGDYIIGTDTTPPIYEMTDDGEYGTIIESENAQQLQQALEKAMESDFYDQQLMNDILEHAQKYRWSQIISTLNRSINEIQQRKGLNN